jgi:predicted nuclease of predicted toxin-antitoxin system
LFIDECLSPILARRLNESGEHDAVHPLDLGSAANAMTLSSSVASPRTG